MVSFSVRRDTERNSYTSHDKYYRALNRRGGLKFCKVIEKASPSIYSSLETKVVDDWHAFPWLTLALGSGCLELSDDPRMDPFLVGDAVLKQVVTLNDDERAERLTKTGFVRRRETFDEPGLAQRFAAAMVRDREQTDPENQKKVEGENTISVSPIAARLVLAAGLLTRFYYTAKAANGNPLPMWDLDRAELEDTESDDPVFRRLKEIAARCNWHCRRAARDLKADPPELLDDSVVGAIADFLDSVASLMVDRGEGNPEQVSAQNLRLVTEMAWYLLTMENGAYPGWTEMLFDLMLSVTQEFDHDRPRPFILKGQAPHVENLMYRATRDSWEHRGDKGPRKQFYLAAASVLWAQQEAVDLRAGSISKETPPLPPVSVFVAGFDIEVEMALWEAAPEGSAYFVVVPVHVFATKHDVVARPCWLRGKVEKTASQPGGAGVVDELDRLRTPSGWELLTGGTTAKELCLGPHVVHLNGAPLIKLPFDALRNGEGTMTPIGVRDAMADLARVHAGLGRVKVMLDRDVMEIQHAVMTDEYLALRHAEVELLLGVAEESDADNRRGRSLPKFLTTSTQDGVGTSGNPRFWLGFGIAISDPGVRHRLASQFTRDRMYGVELPKVKRSVIEQAADADGSPTAGAVMPEVDEWGYEIVADGDPSDSEELIQEGTPLLPSGAVVGVEDTPTPSFGAGGSGGIRTDSLTGVLVNRRTSEDDCYLLKWLGFDVVRDRATSFTGDLLHYAHHLRTGGLRSWPQKNTPCPLKEGQFR